MSTDNQLLDAITREGVLLNVSIKYWRGTKKLKPEELGLDPAKVTKRLISLGHKNLIPKEALQDLALIESRTHAYVDSCTFPFLNGLARYLPNTRLDPVMNRLATLEHEFERASHAFMGNYAELRKEAGNEWYIAARNLVDNPEQLVATIRASFPATEHMARYFMFTTQLFQISVPECLEISPVTWRDQAEVGKARREAVELARYKITSGVDAFVRDCVASLREQTAVLCEEMLESIRTSKSGVHQKTLNRLAKFIDEVKTLNFAGDRELEQQLEDARRKLLSRDAETYRASSRALSSLQEGLRELASTAREMAQADTSELVEQFGQLGGNRRIFRVA